MTDDTLPPLSETYSIDGPALLQLVARLLPGYATEIALVWGMEAPLTVRIDDRLRACQVYVNALASNDVAQRDLDNLLRASCSERRCRNDRGLRPLDRRRPASPRRDAG